MSATDFLNRIFPDFSGETALIWLLAIFVIVGVVPLAVSIYLKRQQKRRRRKSRRR